MPSAASTPPRIHLVATLKNEAPYLIEWIAHYRALGITDFTLFSNDCSDGTNLLLDRLDAMGEVRHFDNPLGPRMDPQRRAYSRAGRIEEVRSAEWILVVDADEFVHVEAGDGTLPALIEACAPADAISLGWRLVGSSDARQWIDAPVTERFTRCGSVEPPENGMVAGFKTLFRPAVFDYFGVHRPKFSKKRTQFPKVTWRNGSGKNIAAHVAHAGWRYRSETAGYDLGWVNHYAVKSREEFLLKRLRGSANTKAEDRLDLSYWKTFDLNSMPLPALPDLGRSEHTARMLADPDVAALRRACVTTARRTIDMQLEQDEAFAFVNGGGIPDAPDLPARAQGKSYFPDDWRDQQKDAPAHRFVMVATMKDEAPYLLEWIAWYQHIGVDHFVIFTNDCSDGTDSMLDRLQELEMVEHCRNDAIRGRAPQFRALTRAAKMESVRNAEWMIHLDADEYLDITAGDGTLDSFIAACDPDGSAHGISIPWRYMGSAGHGLPQNVPLTQRFTRGSRILPQEVHSALSFKSIVRPWRFKKFGIHRPRTKDHEEALVWKNASGEDVSEDFGGENADRKFTRFSDKNVGWEHGCIRHYAVKSRGEYMLKSFRGDATGRADRFRSSYFTVRDVNSEPVAPLDHDGFRAKHAALMADEVLSDLHEEAVAERDSRIATLMQTPANRLFVETGRTQPPPDRKPGRFLCVVTHHKTGTMWMRNTLKAISERQGITMRQIQGLSHLRRMRTDKPRIFVNWNGQLPRAAFDNEAARILHLRRDPRDVLLSGMRYHLRAASAARERFLREQRPEWGGQTYQQHLRSLPTRKERLLFEMENKHRETVEQMLAWASSAGNTIELRYEELCGDTDGEVFRAALVEADVADLDIDDAVQAYLDNALFSGMKAPEDRTQRVALHIHDGSAAQWRENLPRDVAVLYAAQFGEALRVLGYADNDDWIDECPPSEETTEGTTLADEAAHDPARDQTEVL